MRLSLLPPLLAASTYAHLLHSRSGLSELPPPAPFDKGQDEGRDGSYPHHDFQTFTDDVKAPKVNWLTWSPECDDGLYYFLTPRGWSLMQRPGPMILDSRGNLVWAHHYEGENRLGTEGYNFLVQKYQGQDHLTFWLGEDRVKGHGAGWYYFLNSSYDIVDKVHGMNGMWADLHEFLVTDAGDTAVMTLYQTVEHDVSDFREFNPNRDSNDADPNYVWDGVVQEIDLAPPHNVLWQWRSTENIDLHDTYKPIHRDGNHENPWDWFHINSVQKDELGNYLISARFTQAIYYIDGRTKRPIWYLGGKRNFFMDLSGGNATNFAWQHDARFQSLDSFPRLYTPPAQREGVTTKLVSFFDNAGENNNYTYGLPLSRGLLLELTYPTPGTAKATSGAKRHNKQHEPADPDFDGDINEAKVAAINGTDPDYTVRVIMSYDSPSSLRASSQGSMQLLPQGPGEDPRVLVGYGLDAAWTEFDSRGNVLCDAHYGSKTQFETGDMQSYRTYKLPWTGRPSWKPEVKLEWNKLWVSWIGATDIAEWSLQSSDEATDDSSSWKEILRVRKVGFEETITIPKDKGRVKFLRLVALDASGNALPSGASDALRPGLSQAYYSGTQYTGTPQNAEEDVTDPYMVFLIVACVTVFFVLMYAVYRFKPEWRWNGRLPRWYRREQKYELVEQHGD